MKKKQTQKQKNRLSKSEQRRMLLDRINSEDEVMIINGIPTVNPLLETDELELVEDTDAFAKK